MKFFITGAAGFIGFHLARRLLTDGHRVLGIDNLNDYYDPALKQSRLDALAGIPEFSFEKLDIVEGEYVDGLVSKFRPDRFVHLAAQAGVRYSIENPAAYVQANLVGFGNVLEACRRHEVPHLVFASSSSVYGANSRQPYSEKDEVNHPLSLYAATKKANELMAHSYASLYGLPCTGLRFFTVYGPWGRPDMAYFLFTRAILSGEPVKLFNRGEHERDFSYIDDVVEGVVAVATGIARPDPAWDSRSPAPDSSFAPFRLYNIGKGKPDRLLDFVGAIERELGRSAIRDELPLQPGDVARTWADCSALEREFGYRPATTIADGIAKFVAWYRAYYHV